MARKRMLQVFREAAERGPFDEYPVLPAEIDPQLHLSKNDRNQPFFLICEKDCVVVQLGGEARVELRDSSVRYFDTVPGDHVYVPAGTPHRIMPKAVSINARYKAAKAGLEAVSFCCESCGNQLWRQTWDTDAESPQAGYLTAVEAFNADPAKRGCARCGAVHAPIDLQGFRWKEIAEELQGASAEEESW